MAQKGLYASPDRKRFYQLVQAYLTHMASWIEVNIGSGNSLLPDGIPSHYLNQYWLNISSVLYHLPKDNNCKMDKK